MRLLPFSYAIRNLGRGPVRLAASLLGSCLVVLLALAAAGFVRGMSRTLTPPATLHENVILLGAGSEEAIERSQIPASVDSIVAASVPGLLNRGGVVYASPEIHAALPVRLSPDGAELQAVIRGVRDVALLVHPQVEIIEGRFPRAGEDEVMVGSLAATRLGVSGEDLAIGLTIHFDGRDWRIVGRFRAPGTVMDAELWMPLNALQIATKREASLSCVIVSLGSARFADVDLFAKSRLDLEISALREREYYASIGAFYRPIRVMVIVTSLLIASGGILGGLNTMYAAFASRVREIGMLQSLGYTRAAIVLSLVQESLLASSCGAVVAAAIGLLTLDGLAVRFSMGAFELLLDGPVMLTGLMGGLAVGLVGAVPPAIRCLRLPINESLRSF